MYDSDNGDDDYHNVMKRTLTTKNDGQYLTTFWFLLSKRLENCDADALVWY